MQNRISLGIFTLSIFALVVVGSGAAWAASSVPATVREAHNSKFGALLVSSAGLTLYQLGSESKGTIACTGSCAKAWPPLLVGTGAKPVAGAGVSQAKLGTIKRPDHGTQITYGGKALYRFAPDKKPGAVTGQNVAGFHVVVIKAPSAGTAAPSTTSSGPSYG